MNPEFAYFLKVNVAFALFYAFYRLFFYKDTFFKLRRTILLSFFGLALLYPLFNIQEWIIGKQPIAEVIYMYNTVMLPDIAVNGSGRSTDWNAILQTFALVVYGTGVLLLTIRFLTQLSCILRLAYSSIQTTIHGTKVRILSNGAGPFSFFRLIFICPENLSEKETDEILTHECTHVSQWHSIDVITSEIIAIICWFNPFVWLLRREVRHNLEYLADNKVIQAGYDSKSYQYHLLGLAHHSRVYSDLYNSFNVIHLKNRIFMMNKKRSHGIGRAKYLVFIPLVGLLMLVSNIEAVARVTAKLASEASSLVNENKTNAVSASVEDESDKPFTGTNTSIPATNTDTIKGKPTGKVFTMVEHMPKFPGGDEALLEFIYKETKYPATAQAKGIEGRVICCFIVDKEGNICNPEVIRGVDPELDKEAIRVIKAMPKWIPGTQKGQAVNVKYTVPITYKLTSSENGTQKNKEIADAGKDNSNLVFSVVENMPRFPGGDAALLKHLAANIKYPQEAFKKGIKGRVIARFIVEKDGSVSNPEIVNGVEPSLDAEAIRVITTFPKWTPGMQRGQAVRVKYTVPVTFKLQ